MSAVAWTTDGSRRRQPLEPMRSSLVARGCNAGRQCRRASVPCWCGTPEIREKTNGKEHYEATLPSTAVPPFSASSGCRIGARIRYPGRGDRRRYRRCPGDVQGTRSKTRCGKSATWSPTCPATLEAPDLSGYDDLWNDIGQWGARPPHVRPNAFVDRQDQAPRHPSLPPARGSICRRYRPVPRLRSVADDVQTPSHRCGCSA